MHTRHHPPAHPPAHQLRKIVIYARRPELLAPGPDHTAGLYAFLLSRLLMVDEDAYYGTNTDDTETQEVKRDNAYASVKPDILSPFTDWAKATVAPVLRDLAPYYQPSENGDGVWATVGGGHGGLDPEWPQDDQPTLSKAGDDGKVAEVEDRIFGPRMILALLGDFDEHGQCDTVYEGSWSPNDTMDMTALSDATYLNEDSKRWVGLWIDKEAGANTIPYRRSTPPTLSAHHRIHSPLRSPLPRLPPPPS